MNQLQYEESILEMLKADSLYFNLKFEQELTDYFKQSSNEVILYHPLEEMIVDILIPLKWKVYCRLN